MIKLKLCFPLLICGLIFLSGCISDDNVEKTTDYGNPIKTTVTPTMSQKTVGNLEKDVNLANKIIPTEIPGLVLNSKAKDPMSGQYRGDEYTLASYWLPQKGSKFDGPISGLSVDVSIFETSEKAREWFPVYENNADSTIKIENINGVYRYYNGESSIAILQDNFILVICGTYDTQPPNFYHEEGITKEITLEAAKRAVNNLERFS